MCIVVKIEMIKVNHPDYNLFHGLRGGIYVLEGIIGVGKTTFGTSLSVYLNKIGLKARFFPEYVNEMLLSQYIKDMKKYAYSFQLFMLCKRIETYQKAESYVDNERGIAIIDRSLVGDMTFARMQMLNGNMTGDEWETYLSVMKQEANACVTPTFYIFLECTTNTSLERIKQRGNKDEIEGYPEEYLEKLKQAYKYSFETYGDIEYAKVDWSKKLTKTGDQDIFSDVILRDILSIIFHNK